MADIDSVISPATIALALVFGLVLVLIYARSPALRNEAEEYRMKSRKRLAEKKSTEFLDRNKVDDTCDICFGEFGNEEILECSCGMRFHRECAEMTQECPYCKEPPENMEARWVRRPVCPNCGETLEKNVCPHCRTILPNRDMRFECECGSTVYAGDGYCKDCGAEFEFTYDRPVKRY